jgi:predicted NAD-dependent protein-ADP-ribosyltransferase YbiA (DUF1768 family)
MFKDMDKASNKYHCGLVCLMLAITTLVVFWQVLNHDFIDFDDDLYVTKNSNVQGKIDQAIEHYRQALRFRPDDKAVYEVIKKLQAGRKILETPERTDTIQ